MNIPDRVRFGVLSLILFAFAAIPAAEAADVTAEEIADGLYLFHGAGSNVVAMADGRDILVVDGGLEENSKDLFKAIREATGGRDIDTLVNTHWHPEQVGLNERAGKDNAAIIAHEQTYVYLSTAMTSPLFSEFGEPEFNKRFGPLDEDARPNQIIRDMQGELSFGGQTVEYGYLPAAHTNGDLYVYFPEQNVLAAGGAVGSDSWPLIDYWNGAWIGGFLQGYEKLATIVDDETVVIPAQGPAMTGAKLKEQLGMYRQLFRDLHWLMNEGMGYNDVVMLNPLKNYEAEYGDPSAFLDGAYRSLEMSNVPD